MFFTFTKNYKALKANNILRGKYTVLKGCFFPKKVPMTNNNQIKTKTKMVTLIYPSLL